jgi:hypothetical protein
VSDHDHECDLLRGIITQIFFDVLTGEMGEVTDSRDITTKHRFTMFPTNVVFLTADEVEAIKRANAEWEGVPSEPERDRLREELAFIAFAVAGDRTGIVHEHEIVPLVQAVVAERDRLQDQVGQLEAERSMLEIRTAERDQLRKVIDDIRVRWENIFVLELDNNTSVAAFPMAHHDAIYKVLDDLLDDGKATHG